WVPFEGASCPSGVSIPGAHILKTVTDGGYRTGPFGVDTGLAGNQRKRFSRWKPQKTLAGSMSKVISIPEINRTASGSGLILRPEKSRTVKPESGPVTSTGDTIAGGVPDVPNPNSWIKKIHVVQLVAAYGVAACSSPTVVADHAQRANIDRNVKRHGNGPDRSSRTGRHGCGQERCQR